MFSAIKKTFKLAWILLKGSSYERSSSNGLKKNNNKWIYIVLPLCFLPIIINMISFLIMGFKELQPIGDEYLLIKTYLTLSALITLFLGFFYAVSILFFSTDNDILSHLPLHPWQICSARFMVILIYEYLFEAFIFIPFIFTYGIMSKAGILFYIYAIIAGITIPILPVSLLSVIAMLLMRFVPFFKSKDRVNLFSALLSIALIFGLYVPFMSNISAVEEESVSAIFYMIAGGSDSVASVLGKILPSLSFSFESLNNYSNINGLIFILLTLAVSAVAFILFMAISNLIYQKAASGITDAKAKHKKLSSAEISQKSQKTSTLLTLIIKEIRIAMRSPIYFMNCILMTWIFPVLFGVFFFMADSSGELLTEFRSLMANISVDYLPFIFAGITGITAFISSTSCFTATAISREGQHISFSKMIPVPYHVQLKAKLYASILICGIPCAVVIFAAAVFLNCSILYSLLFAAVALITFFYTACIGLLVDMGRPKLIWDNEQAAVKQNINSLIGLALSIPVVLVIIGITIVAFLLNAGAILSCIIHIALALGASALFMYLIYKNANKCYNNIEV